MHKIKIDTERSIITLFVEGFQAIDDFQSIMADLVAARRNLTCASGKHILICDFTGLKVIAQDDVIAVASELNSQGLHDAEWLAIILSSALLKLQFQRILTRSNAGIFDTKDDAWDWLFTSSDHI